MNWYYAEAGQHKGPVTDAELEALLQAGRITRETLIWREGLATWGPYSKLKPAGPSGALPGEGQVVCAECGKTFPKAEVIRYGDVSVCAACKPIFVQRIKEGGQIRSAAGTLTREQLLARDYEISIGDLVKRSWALLFQNPVVLIGGCVLVFIVMMAMGFIPILGSIVNFFVSPAIIAGIYMMFLKQMRQGSVDISEIFSQFGPRFWSFLVINLCTMGVVIACLIPAIVVGLGAIFSARQSSEPSIIMLALAGMLSLAGILVAYYFILGWMFAPMLVVDKKMPFWPAMQISRAVVRKRFWSVFGALFVGGLIYVLGVLACGVGILVTGPLFMAIMVVLYEDIFGALAPEGN